jgi:2-methylisocitrate lyase-like PEP mutase family enzyme
MGFGGGLYPVQALAEAGVKRISVGGSFARAALAGLARAAREVQDHGTFTYVEEAMPFSEANGYMAPASRESESGG